MKTTLSEISERPVGAPRATPVRREWQADRERRSPSGALACRFNASLVTLDDVLGESEAEAQTALHRIVRLPEPLKNTRQCLSSDARAIVRDSH